MVRVFANGPGALGSIPERVIPKTQKWYLMLPCLILSITKYGSRVKWVNPGKGVTPSTIYIYIYIYMSPCVCLSVSLSLSFSLFLSLSLSGCQSVYQYLSLSLSLNVTVSLSISSLSLSLFQSLSPIVLFYSILFHAFKIFPSNSFFCSPVSLFNGISKFVGYLESTPSVKPFNL